MKLRTLSLRTSRELLRDPLTVAFGLGFSVVLLLLMTAIERNIPVQMFPLTQLAPGISVFSLAFLSLFSATLISKDRLSALLQRLYTAPLSPWHFILSYTLPMLPLAVGQSLICYLLALVLGLPFTWNIAGAVLLNLPMAWLYTALGLLCGSVMTDKQVGGICGAALTNLAGWLSGIWFDLDLVGGGFRTVAGCLPFYHAVEVAKGAYAGAWEELLPHMLWVAGYGIVITGAAVMLFFRQMKKQ